MPGPPPPTVSLSEEEHQALRTLIRAHKTPQHLSFRAQIILLLAEGLKASPFNMVIFVPEAWRSKHACRSDTQCA
jgi:hypothetical protein